VLTLKENGRSAFKIPFGEIYPSIKDLKKNLEKYKSNRHLIISIGDVTTINLQEEDVIPHMAIIDNRIERKESPQEDKIFYQKAKLNAENPPGTITQDLWKTIKQGFQLLESSRHNVLIVVDGEEDLAVLPCVIMAPPGSVLLYGQPGEGVVLCEVDKFKDKAIELINKFEGDLSWKSM
jgi:uncharacterized protein (UPF0218 family)